MLSRVADSLYWMSRYFERADHCARVLDANYSLMLNPSKASTELRWKRITTSLGIPPGIAQAGTPSDIFRLLSDGESRSSILACVTSARENASQIREQISSEMWERLNQLFHETTRLRTAFDTDLHPLRLVATVREGCYRLYGATDATMSHDEGWHFIRLGRYMERACAVSRLVDAYFDPALASDDLDWAALLSSCLAFEAYCKVYTADLRARRVAEFILLNPDFPYTVRHSTEGMYIALSRIAAATSGKVPPRIERIAGQLRSSLAYADIGEIMRTGLNAFTARILDYCLELHNAVYEIYVEYPVAEALEV